MKLLHVVPSYLPARRYGGPVVAIHALCRELVRAGCDVEVWTTDADGPGRLDVPPEGAWLDGVRVHWSPRARPSRLYRAPGLDRALRERAQEFDLVHLHSVFLWPTSSAARAARRAGVPWVVSPRGMLVPELFRARGRLRKRAWLALAGRRQLEGAAFVHATSALEERDARRFDLEWPPFRVIPNGVEPPDPAAASSALPPALERIVAGPALLFLGRLSWKKGLDRLIDALGELRRAQLVLAGPDDEGLGRELDNRAARVGAAGRVHRIGAVYGATKAALLARAAALVLPSHSENFGNVVLEALAQGTPVVTTPEVGAAEVVRTTGAGFLTGPRPDAAALAETLRCMLALDAGERARLGERGREVVLREYSWRAVAERMLAAYGEALSDPAERAAA